MVNDRNFVRFLVIVGIVMMVAAFTVSIRHGDITLPSCKISVSGK